MKTVIRLNLMLLMSVAFYSLNASAGGGGGMKGCPGGVKVEPWARCPGDKVKTTFCQLSDQGKKKLSSVRLSTYTYAGSSRIVTRAHVTFLKKKDRRDEYGFDLQPVAANQVLLSQFNYGMIDRVNLAVVVSNDGTQAQIAGEYTYDGKSQVVNEIASCITQEY